MTIPIENVKVLMIEDNAVDARLFLEMIREVTGSERFQIETVTTLAAGIEKLSSSHQDLVLLDLNLPDSVGLETYTRLRSAHQQVPVILMTGLSDESLAIQAVREGVQDYLVKGRVDGNLVTRAMAYAIERKQMEGRLRVADRMISVGMLAAGVAHEINNPLTYVISTLNLIDEALSDLVPRDGTAPSKASQQKIDSLRRMLQNAEGGAERVRRIVSELKMFSRVGDAKPGRVDVKEVLESTLKMVANQVRQRARLVLDYQSSPLVLGNADRLAQVFVNLLVNAAQSIPEGNPDRNEVRVSIFSEVSPQSGAPSAAIIEVSDTGCGIPTDLQPKVFKPFFTTKAVGEGTGLGLSICYQIISGLGGTITFRSEPGQGTRFRISLPEVVQDRPGLSRDPQEISPAAMPHGSGARATPKARVLVIDDEPVIGEVITQGLAGEHDVEAVTSGEEALTRISHGAAYDVIFCDLMMPGMTGPEVYTELEKRHPGMEKKMIFISGGAFTDRAREFLASVPNSRMDKPFTLRILRQVLRRWLSERAEPGSDEARADGYNQAPL